MTFREVVLATNPINEKGNNSYSFFILEISLKVWKFVVAMGERSTDILKKLQFSVESALDKGKTCEIGR